VKFVSAEDVVFSQSEVVYLFVGYLMMLSVARLYSVEWMGHS
jgi:hypothetical protein